MWSTYTRKLITEIVMILSHFFLDDQFMGLSGSWSAGSFHHTTKSEPGAGCAVSLAASSLGGSKAEGVSAPEPLSFSSSSEISPASSCRGPASSCVSHDRFGVVFDEDCNDVGWCGMVKFQASCVLLVKAQLDSTTAENMQQREDACRDRGTVTRVREGQGLCVQENGLGLVSERSRYGYGSPLG